MRGVIIASSVHPPEGRASKGTLRASLRLMGTTSLALLLLALVLGPAAAQSEPPRQFISRSCGFQAKIPTGWRIKPSASQKCAFTVVAPQHHTDGNLELLVRSGDLEQGSDDLGFVNDDGKWTLQGEGSAQAVQVESQNWLGLQGSVDTRIYEKGSYCCIGLQTRVLLFDRKRRIAEVTTYSGDKTIPEFINGFEFIGERPR